MGWVGRLEGRIVGLDTSPLIYFVEEHPKYHSVVKPFFEAVHNRRISSITSVITFLEVMVQPLRRGAGSLVDHYRNILFDSPGIECLPVSQEIAAYAARLRADYNLRTPDAIQLATAVVGGAAAFLTNDARLPSIPGLAILVIDRL